VARRRAAGKVVRVVLPILRSRSGSRRATCWRACCRRAGRGSWCPLGAIASAPALAGWRMCGRHCCSVSGGFEVLVVGGSVVAGSAAYSAVGCACWLCAGCELSSWIGQFRLHARSQVGMAAWAGQCSRCSWDVVGTSVSVKRCRYMYFLVGYEPCEIGLKSAG
jgi:hypothetical protein